MVVHPASACLGLSSKWPVANLMVTRWPCPQVVLIETAARVMGRLVKGGGAVTSDIVEREVGGWVRMHAACEECAGPSAHGTHRVLAGPLLSWPEAACCAQLTAWLQAQQSEPLTFLTP